MKPRAAIVLSLFESCGEELARHCNIRSVVALSTVSSHLHNVCDNETVWEWKVREHYPTEKAEALHTRLKSWKAVVEQELWKPVEIYCTYHSAIFPSTLYTYANLIIFGTGTSIPDPNRPGGKIPLREYALATQDIKPKEYNPFFNDQEGHPPITPHYVDPSTLPALLDIFNVPKIPKHIRGRLCHAAKLTFYPEDFPVVAKICMGPDQALPGTNIRCGFTLPYHYEIGPKVSSPNIGDTPYKGIKTIKIPYTDVLEKVTEQSDRRVFANFKEQADHRMVCVISR